MKKNILLIILVLAFAVSAAAESDFDKWKKEQQKAFTGFLSEEEKAFSDMLKKEWEEYRTRKGFIPDTAPKPENQPVLTVKKEADLPPSTKNREKNEVTGPPANKPSPSPSRPSEPAEEKRSYEIKPISQTEKNIKINFYGVPVAIPLSDNFRRKEITQTVTNKSVSGFFEYYSKQDLAVTIDFIKSLKTDYSMNGWSLIKITDRISEEIYNDSARDRILLNWFLLIKSGYDVKIAYSDRNVYLLYLPETIVYSTPYITEGKKNYYFFNKSDSDNERIKTYNGDLLKNPETVYMKPENPENFQTDMMKRKTSFIFNKNNYSIQLEYNKNLVDYYKEYPQVDISYYFGNKASEKALSSYRESLYPYIDGKSETEAVSFILSFVQKGFEYKTDEMQFGYEKPMFPDEAIHYPYIDCEDRSALFLSIVKELTGLDAVALDYPGHISAAVSFRGDVEGDSVDFRGKKYIICDPTYINADIGMSMPEFRNIKPVIIETEY